MSTELEIMKEKGLSEDEAKLIQNWMDRGKPGLHKVKAEHLSVLYMQGYSCEDINRFFPEYELPLLLWAKMKYDWDLLREKYRRGVTDQVLQSAMAVKAESIRFLSDLLTATHVAWKQEIMRFLAAPDREERPKCLPASLHQYSSLIQLLTELTTPKTQKGGDEVAATPLKTVVVEQPEIIEVNQQDVKEALLRKMRGEAT